MPAGREIGSQRTVDESGYGHGVGPVWVPLQGEWHELARRYRADDRLGVCGRQGWNQQDPVDVALVGPADGGQVGVGELDGRRGDACGAECQALGQCPSEEQGLRGGAQQLVGEFGQRDRVAAGQAMVWAQATTSGSAQNTSVAIPADSGTGPQVRATSMAPVTTASRSVGGHIRCNSTVASGAWAANRLIRWGRVPGRRAG